MHRLLALVLLVGLPLSAQTPKSARSNAMDHDLTLRDAALKLGFVTEEQFDRVVDPAKMVGPYVAAAPEK